MTDLPIEHELIDGEWYFDELGNIGRWASKVSKFWSWEHNKYIGLGNSHRIFRLAKTAEYRPAPAEPKGLGAVVRDGQGQVWVRAKTNSEWPWRKTTGVEIHWQHMVENASPIKVLSEGVTL